jgi:beta-lactamase regulating signal transducer with metallopeptidase domain
MIIDVIAWTLLHFVWQGAGIAAVVALGLHALDAAPAAARYRLACGGLVAMALAPLLTAALLGAGGAPSTALAWTSAAASAPTLSWTWAVVGAWLLGVAVCLGRHGLQLVRLELLRQRSIAAPPALAARFRVLARRLGLRRVQLRLIPTGTTPMALGLLRPVVLLPASLLVHLPPQQIEALLVHELAHVRRHDWAVNIAQAAVESLLFFHPATHWLSRTVRHERELCCDELAAATLSDPVGYARALTELAALRVDGVFTLAPAARGGLLMDRIARIVGHPLPRHRPVWVLPALILSTVVGLTTAAVAVARAPEPLDDDGLAAIVPEEEAEDDDDVTAVEDVGARALEVLSDGLQRGADHLDEQAERLEAKADERQERRRERREGRAAPERAEPRVRVRVHEHEHASSDSELEALERERDEVARLRGQVRTSDGAVAPTDTSGCSRLVADGHTLVICGEAGQGALVIDVTDGGDEFYRFDSPGGEVSWPTPTPTWDHEDWADSVELRIDLEQAAAAAASRAQRDALRAEGEAHRSRARELEVRVREETSRFREEAQREAERMAAEAQRMAAEAQRMSAEFRRAARSPELLDPWADAPAPPAPPAMPQMPAPPADASPPAAPAPPAPPARLRPR